VEQAPGAGVGGSLEPPRSEPSTSRRRISKFLKQAGNPQQEYRRRQAEHWTGDAEKRSAHGFRGTPKIRVQHKYHDAGRADGNEPRLWKTLQVGDGGGQQPQKDVPEISIVQRRSKVVAAAAMKVETKLQRTYKPAGDRPLQSDHRGKT